MLCSISIGSVLQPRPSCGFPLVLHPKLLEKKLLFVKWATCDCGLTGNIRILVGSTKKAQRRCLPGKTKQNTRRARMGIWPHGRKTRTFQRNVWGRRSCGVNKASLQSACCCFCLTQSSHEHFIWIKERVCTFTGSLTTLSSSARRFLSSHAPPKAARQVPMILFSHEGTKFQVDFKKNTHAGPLRNVLLGFCPSWSVAMFCLRHEEI